MTVYETVIDASNYRDPFSRKNCSKTKQPYNFDLFILFDINITILQ